MVLSGDATMLTQAGLRLRYGCGHGPPPFQSNRSPVNSAPTTSSRTLARSGTFGSDKAIQPGHRQTASGTQIRLQGRHIVDEALTQLLQVQVFKKAIEQLFGFATETEVNRI